MTGCSYSFLHCYSGVCKAIYSHGINKAAILEEIFKGPLAKTIIYASTSTNAHLLI